MKLCQLFILPAMLGSVCEGFSMMTNARSATTTQLQAEMGRREMIAAAGLSAGTLMIPLESAFAAYEPKPADIKQIYFLGTSLDNLITKLEDPSQLDAALTAVKLFNKDPDFYSGYAKNFIMKSVKKGSDNDPRVGYIKQASKLVSSLESVLEGGDALMNEKSTSAEAVARVKKAQALIAKFIEESGTKDERFDAFIASHK